MELTVRVERILTEQCFTSRKDGSEVRKYGFVGVTTNERFEKRICFYAFGETWAGANIVVGGTYEVSFDVASREYNGRWYTECTCWKISAVSAANAQTPVRQVTVAPPTQTNNNSYNVVPF